MKNTLRIALSAAVLWGTTCQAEIFVGGALGHATIDDSTTAIVPVSVDDNATAWKFFGGMMITENFGFEAGYTRLTDINEGGVGVETDAFIAAGIAALPIGEAFSIYGKVGIASWDQNINNSSYDGVDYMAGVGAKYLFGGQYFARVEWETYDAKLAMDVISIGVGVQF